jgi:hypothetical protein
LFQCHDGRFLLEHGILGAGQRPVKVERMVEKMVMPAN